MQNIISGHIKDCWTLSGVYLLNSNMQQFQAVSIVFTKQYFMFGEQKPFGWPGLISCHLCDLVIHLTDPWKIFQKHWKTSTSNGWTGFQVKKTFILPGTFIIQ